MDLCAPNVAWRLLAGRGTPTRRPCGGGSVALRAATRMNKMNQHGLELRSKITSDGLLELFLEDTPVPEPAADEIVIRIEAAPLNPSDIILLLGPADPSAVRALGTAETSKTVAIIPKERIAGLQARLDVALPVGNEG